MKYVICNIFVHDSSTMENFLDQKVLKELAYTSKIKKQLPNSIKEINYNYIIILVLWYKNKRSKPLIDREPNMKKLTFTMENYLEAIYELSRDNQGARVSDIAERLGVTKASTNSAMATLASKGLIINEKYKEVVLTPEGLKIAKFTAEKHQTIKRFFTEILGIDIKIADTDACAIEHVISNESVIAMREFMQKKGEK